MPLLHLLAGPNGSGKSSYVRDVLGPITRLPFVNADEIATAHWPGNESAHAYDASRLAAVERERLLRERRSFITETVFSHPSKVDLLRHASTLGYLVHLHVMIVPVDLSVQRVADRVRRGGHSVPEQKLRERHARLWTHVAEAITIADVTEVFDNSSATQPFRLVARYAAGQPTMTPDLPGWALFTADHSEPPDRAF